MFKKDKAPDYEIDGVLHRLCDRCGETKALEDNYYLCSDRKSRRHKCKNCVDEERRERGTVWTSEQKRESRIRRVYGLRTEQFDAMWAAQNGLCKICDEPLTIDSKNTETNANIDHCHDSNLVRGLLCSRCNRGLGQFRDSQELLRRAADYLSGPFIEPVGLLTKGERAVRVTGRITLTAWGETKTIVDWLNDERCAVGYNTIRSRIKRYNWSAEDAISVPPVKPYELRKIK